MRKLIAMRIVIFGVLLMGASGLSAQILHPVKWSYGAKRLNREEAVVFLKATIADGWHIYSAYQKEGGPVPTKIAFDPSAAYSLLGQLSEPAPITKFEDAFNMKVGYFEQAVIFKQKVSAPAGKGAIRGSVTFMVCNDHQCLPPETIPFTVPIP
jgi:DsbC/DsbD-like thiol-disulfide interchange protein